MDDLVSPGADAIPLSLRLEKENTTIIIDKQLEITFRRTIRFADDKAPSKQPLDFGAFKLTNVKEGLNRLPAAVKSDGGLLLPMHEGEAMWIKFVSLTKKPYAIKIFGGKTNVITGEIESEHDGEEKEHQKRRLAAGKSLQDYFVVPAQPWLYGYRSETGKFQQFVAPPLDKTQPFQAQEVPVEYLPCLRFEITPKHVFKTQKQLNPMGSRKLRYFSNLVKTGPRKGNFFIAEIGIDMDNTISVRLSTDWKVERVCQKIQHKLGPMYTLDHLIINGQCLLSYMTLSYYGITKEYFSKKTHHRARIAVVFHDMSPATVQIPPYIKWCNLAIAEGGVTCGWNPPQTTVFTIRPLLSPLYQSLTGLQNPNKPIPQEVYETEGGAMPARAEKRLPARTRAKGKRQTQVRSTGQPQSSGFQPVVQKSAEAPNHFPDDMEICPSDIQRSSHKPNPFKSVDQWLEDLNGLETDTEPISTI
ncbi:hypothetical protein TWF730_001836 [Orbilia blumenaviensis]|uniref:Uncharacterized protein n=1 Tax=Orbilia blumenaviensis TaxID=1796055 RepID=A0AAV9UC70_9PEZI